MAAKPETENEPPPGSKAFAIGRVSLILPLVLALMLVVIYDRLKAPLYGGLNAAGATYAEWFSNFVSSPDNEQARATLISHVVQAYRETPVGKSVPLRDDLGRVVGRFCITDVVSSPHEGDRSRFDVKMRGRGELWHKVGGRVRFEGGASTSYKIDFKPDQWRIFTYFDCLELADLEFHVTHVDNVLAQIFSTVVNDAGKKAIADGMKPGFTLITYFNGKSYIAQGRANSAFRPNVGPFAEEAGWETICNDISLLNGNYRDYIGPFDITPRARLRLELSVAGADGGSPPGVDMLLVKAADFDAYEQKYWAGTPGPMQDYDPPAVEARYNTREMKFANDGAHPLPDGTYYLVIDRTRAGRGDQSAAGIARGAEIKYYARIQR